MYSMKKLFTFLIALSLCSAAFANPEKVVIYSTKWCPYCNQAKAYFDSVGIQFTDYDIEDNAQARENYKTLKGRGIPLVFIGTDRFDGYDPQALEQALRTHGLLPAA